MKVFGFQGRMLLFTEQPLLVGRIWYQVVSSLWGVNWSRWAFKLQLGPCLCEQVHKLSRIKGGVAVSSKRGEREASAPGSERCCGQYSMVKGGEPGVLEC